MFYYWVLCYKNVYKLTFLRIILIKIFGGGPQTSRLPQGKYPPDPPVAFLQLNLDPPLPSTYDVPNPPEFYSVSPSHPHRVLDQCG